MTLVLFPVLVSQMAMFRSLNISSASGHTSADNTSCRSSYKICFEATAETEFSNIFSGKQSRQGVVFVSRCLIRIVCLLFSPVLIEIGICRQIVIKSPNMKTYENLSAGSGVVAFGQADGWTDRHDGVSTVYSPCKDA